MCLCVPLSGCSMCRLSACKWTGRADQEVDQLPMQAATLQEQTGRKPRGPRPDVILKTALEIHQLLPTDLQKAPLRYRKQTFKAKHAAQRQHRSQAHRPPASSSSAKLHLLSLQVRSSSHRDAPSTGSAILINLSRPFLFPATTTAIALRPGRPLIQAPHLRLGTGQPQVPAGRHHAEHSPALRPQWEQQQ